ncbi:MAG TPA: winged helix-turn-helix domain-containing protein [Vicinamibacterales bacterium]|nr:winged helix-turn-helix domain-containing protein [Vicinamibacterales bacterium]
MIYRFGTFEFDSDTGALGRSGRAIALEPQPAKALTLLLARPGEVVTREELKAAVWGSDTHVDFDRGIAYCISQVRTALSDNAENPRFIQTIPRVGFKFIAPVSTSEVPATTPAARSFNQWVTIPLVLVMFAVVLFATINLLNPPEPENIVHIAVSIFDNETGQPEYDRRVAGLSDLVVERLSKLDPERVAVVGNAAVLRQPRNIRNLKVVAQSVHAEYVLLGQLQRGETGLRFITHFIRLADEAHLKANRINVAENLNGLEAAVVEEFERAVREHVLTRNGN